MIDSIAKSLRESLHIAADLAGDMTRIARARLDIASTKKDIRRTQAALGAFVHQNRAKLDLNEQPEVQQWIAQLDALQDELSEREEALEELQRQQSAHANEIDSD